MSVDMSLERGDVSKGLFKPNVITVNISIHTNA